MNPVLDEKKQAELEFWKNLYNAVGREAFGAIREHDYADYTRNYPDNPSVLGQGLDLGSGPWSVFEGQYYHNVVAADPMMLEYRQIINPPYTGVIYKECDDNDLSIFNNDTFDWVWCVNVIDHTPNPELLLQEVRRVLKPDGSFYFAVWFDPALYAPHYKLWNVDTVNEYLKDFQLLRGTLELWEAHSKYRYWGLYR